LCEVLRAPKAQSAATGCCSATEADGSESADLAVELVRADGTVVIAGSAQVAIGSAR